MEITEVRIKLVERSSERLRAFCSVTLDGDFVIRDLKIIDGTNGVFVAMPSRKLADRCPRCGSKNHLRAKHCNDCGARLNENRAPKDAQGRAKLHADVAHPINAACRERIQKAVVEAFNAELERSKSPDYRPAKYDDFEVDLDEEAGHPKPAVAEAPKPPPSPVREPEPESKPEAEPAGIAEPPEQQEEFGDYNSLIAELKRDAANRRERHEEQRPLRNSAPPPQRGGGGPRPDRGGRDRRGQGGQGRDRGGQGGQGRDRRESRPEGERPPQTRPEQPAPPPPPPRAPEPPPLRPEPPAPPADDDFGAGL